MIKNLIKGFILCTCLTGLTVDAMGPGEELVERSRSISDPVTKREMDEVMHILKKDDFLGISPEQASKIKSIKFEGIDWTVETLEHWNNLFFSKEQLDSLTFDNCRFLIDYACLCSVCPIVHLTITNCGLTAADAETILREVDPYIIRTINFSNNKLKEAGFYNMIRSLVGGGLMSLDVLDLRRNGLTPFPFNDQVTTVYF